MFARQIPIELDYLFILIVLVVLLTVAIAGRMLGKGTLQTICLACAMPFQGHARADFLGFRQMRCPSCDVAGPYPMSRVYVWGYALLLFSVGAMTIVKLLTDEKWRPSLGGIGILVLPPIALARNHRLWQRLRKLTADAREPIVPMQKVEQRQLPR